MIVTSKHVRKLIHFQLVLLPVMLIIWSYTGIPWAVMYVFDLLVCIEFAWAFQNIRPVLRRADFRRLTGYLTIFVLFLFFTQLFNLVSPVNSLLAYRRTFRFILFYISCVVLLREQDVERIMNTMLKLQTVNLWLSLFQYFVQGLSQDYLGGIFGIEVGANAYSNVFLCIICAFVIVKYLAKKVNFTSMAWILVSSLLIAALAELKIFFIEIVVIVVLAMLFSHPSARTLKIMAFSAIGFIAAIILFGRLFPEHMAILINRELFVRYTTQAMGGYNIGRLNAFSEINRIFFKDNLWRNLFGYGFGNCEEGSAFYTRYYHYHYTWFTHQVTFLETGYVGTVLYALFYVLIYRHAAKSKKKNPEKEYWYSFTQIICVLCAIWMAYNQSMRIEAAFILFFVLAIPVIIRNGEYLQKMNTCILYPGKRS